MAKEPRILARHFLEASPGTATFADPLGSGRDAEVLVLAGTSLTAYGADGSQLGGLREGLQVRELGAKPLIDDAHHRMSIGLARGGGAEPCVAYGREPSLMR